MAQNNLPNVINTVGELMSFDNGNLFNRDFLFPKRAEKRLEAQKEVLLKVIDTNKETTLAKIEAEKQLSLAQMKYSYDIQELKHETIRQCFQAIQGCACDLDRLNDFLSSNFANLGNVISNL